MTVYLADNAEFFRLVHSIDFANLADFTKWDLTRLANLTILGDLAVFTKFFAIFVDLAYYTEFTRLAKMIDFTELANLNDIEKFENFTQKYTDVSLQD